MSFKREGDDLSQFNKLMKRRITELLAEDIPEDEAKLLCNGRFACTVCPSKPIFDTVNVLTLHRKGKKHTSNLEIHAAKKRELKNLIATRKHEQYLKDRSMTIKMVESKHSGLLSSCTYDSRVKKIKVNRGERKPVLDISKDSRTFVLQSANTLYDDTLVTASTSVKNLAFNSSAINKHYLSGHTYQLKDIFTERKEDYVRIVPYKSTSKRSPSIHQYSSLITEVKSALTSNKKTYPSCKPLLKICDSGVPFSSLKDSYKFPERTLNKNKFTEIPLAFQPEFTSYVIPNGSNAEPHKLLHCERKVSPQSNSINPVELNEISSTLEPSLQHCTISQKYRAIQADLQTQQLFLNTSLPPFTSPSPPTITFTKCCSSSAPLVQAKTCSNVKTATELNERTRKLRQLQGSGWKRDWDGKWIKDDQAEFDSDDEPPDF